MAHNTNKPCRIASYCTSVAWGGLEMNVLRFLKWMRQRGWDTHLFTRPDARMFEQAPKWGVDATVVNSRMKTGDLVNAWRLSLLLKRNRIDRLIIHQSRDMFVGVFAKKFSGGRVTLIYSQHMHIGGDKKDAFHSWLYKHFDAWVTPVQWLADRVLEKTTLNPNLIHIIPRGIEMDDFTVNKPTRNEARKRLDLPEDAFVIGIVGRLDPKKCQDVVIKALARVIEAGHDVHLVLVGARTVNEGDDYAASVHKLVPELGLSDRVHFRGHDPEVQYAYAALDIFVLASQSECYGMVTIEAMSSGLPVIGTNDGGTVSLITPEKTGLLVTPKDVDELTAALIRFVEEPEFTRTLAHNAGEEAKTRFSHLSQCEAWERLLPEL